MSFDGFDAPRKVLLEAKYGYSWQLEDWAQRFDIPGAWRAWARERIRAAGGTPIEAHFSNQKVADFVRDAVRGLRITIVHTPKAF